ncbi:hypothetical protein RN001_013251 [Aquatica leii]|uniref:Uncharacterized protein n=1 Tax=Aquatica leii TaxID=1421715 RepID=A0AAN7P468_9COLE|nr:hypothetical protein RN001_013251 [Aquatica leii]
MEPAAPGTEDEVKLPVQSHVSKKETEQERLLSIKTRLPNGKVDNVFELNINNLAEHWYCNLCQCPVMGLVYHHEIGKRHSSNMQNAGTYAFESDLLQVAPGEPVPPGVDEEVEKIAQIQETLDNYTIGPLIGLEYLIELFEYDREKEPSYLCLLCDKRGDPRTVISHLASYNHIIQYIQRHFTKCFRALAPYITKQYKRNWQSATQKIAEEIENKFGRLKPHVAEAETFTEKRMHFQNLVANGRHLSEKSGVTFEELIDEKELTKVTTDEVIMTKLSDDVSKRVYRITGTEPGSETTKKVKRSPSPPVVAKPKKLKKTITPTEKRRSLSSVSSISSSDLSDFDPAEPTFPKRKYQREKFQPHKPFHDHRIRKSRSRSRSPVFHRAVRGGRGRVHPWERSDYIKSRAELASEKNKSKSDKLEEFKKLSLAIENDMDRVLKQHEKNPEKHPQYNEEWKQFWNKRYKELQAAGKDASNYDFKPDWIKFWNKRMIEIHNSEVKVKKDALRKRLSLPEEPAPICFKITGKKKPSKEADVKVEVPSTVDHDSDVIVIEDKDEDTISSKRSHSPWETEVVSRSVPRRSREKSPEVTRDLIKDHTKPSRDKSKEYRSRSNSREKDWRRKSKTRDRDYHRDYPHDAYYRDSYRKVDLPDYIKPPRVMRDVTRHPVVSPPLSRRVETIESDSDDGDVNVVGILRLLTALEEKLGSLGPKVIDLLAQALKMEKTEANSSETLLDNEMNCVLFETIKEKLKGQLLAGLVDYNQEKAFKNAIKKIASLVHYSGERKKQLQKEKPKVDPIKVPGIGTVDKAAIAKQIATALVLQGKTDVSQAELEQLINAVVGMAEASKNSDKPMTTANFLQQLSQPKQPETPTETFTQSLQTMTPEPESSSSMEGLSDLDLQTLLQNFKDLCTDEQHSLISYLKKLESKEPERVERLRKFVNLDAEKNPEPAETIRRTSPFSNRLQAANPIVEEKIEEVEKAEAVKLSLDSDDDDYTFEDVFKAAKQTVKDNEERERNAKLPVFKTDGFDLTNAKSLIANIMGQLKSNNESANVNFGLGGSSSTMSTPQSEKNYFSATDALSIRPMLQSRVDFTNDSILRHNVEPDSRNYRPNVVYPQHNQYVKPPDNQHQFNRQNFDQYSMHDNGRW